VKFRAKIAEQMLQPAPPEVRKALKLKRGATMYDAMVAALIMNAATGDNAAFMNAHDIVDGPIVQKHFNLTASMERFLADEKFRDWLDSQHSEYLSQIGVTDNERERFGIPDGSPLSKILGGRGNEEGEEDS
jgi:hypothetical protein